MSLATWLVDHEGPVRLAVFAGVLLILALLQLRWATRGDGRPGRRQGVNLALVAIDTVLLRVAFPTLAVAWAAQVHGEGGGLFGLLALPGWLEIVAALLLLDLAVYWQHRLLHEVPLLWRMHRVHHSDTGFDVTTGVRFHPLEIVASMAVKLGLIGLLGPHPVAVVLFELLLSSASLYTHADLALPRRADRALRWLLVTPSMHRIHHSVLRHETNSNYGFHLTLWDRLFGSYVAEPEGDERSMPIGLDQWRRPREQTLAALLLQPFRSLPSEPKSDA